MAPTRKKSATHENIVAKAASRLARDGIQAASVARVMKDAGLTVGGFYAHFTSKSHLAAEALTRAFRENMGALFEGTEDEPPNIRYDKAVRRYLSRQHRDTEPRPCPVPACLSEVRSDDVWVRDALIEGVDELAKRLAPLLDDRPGLTSRERALATAATFIGAMSLARATRGTRWSDEVLLAARKMLLHLEGENR